MIFLCLNNIGFGSRCRWCGTPSNFLMSQLDFYLIVDFEQSFYSSYFPKGLCKDLRDLDVSAWRSCSLHHHCWYKHDDEIQICDDATSVQCLHIIANAGLCSLLHPSLGISDWLVRAIAVSIYLLLRGDLAPHWSTSTTLTGYWLHIWWFVHKSLSLGHHLFSITLFGCFELIYRTIVISVLCLVR